MVVCMKKCLHEVQEPTSVISEVVWGSARHCEQFVTRRISGVQSRVQP